MKKLKDLFHRAILTYRNWKPSFKKEPYKTLLENYPRGFLQEIGSTSSIVGIGECQYEKKFRVGSTRVFTVRTKEGKLGLYSIIQDADGTALQTYSGYYPVGNNGKYRYVSLNRGRNNWEDPTMVRYDREEVTFI